MIRFHSTLGSDRDIHFMVAGTLGKFIPRVACPNWIKIYVHKYDNNSIGYKINQKIGCENPHACYYGNMTYKLYLDDIRNPKARDFIVVRSFDAAVNYVNQHGFPNYVSLDHDLGDAYTKTGYDFAKWLVSVDLVNNSMPDDFDFNVHSANPVGAKNIIEYFKSYLSLKARARK